mmetsp:Transcript_9018/g.14648  ORF Transcript_9018/g.14648 Transcript_9018/m.14648 type:complete len:109 (-) Transcript_9018:133-459(-)
MGIGEGNWRKVGNLLKFWIEIEGFEKFDVSLPKGKLHFTTNAWGNVLRQKGNVLTIRATRFLVRKEWRMVGTFAAEQVQANDESVTLPPCRSYMRGGNNGDFYEDSDY